MTDSTIKLATYNCNSIRSRMDLIREWLTRERPDVLCLQETKVQDPDFPAGPLHELGYHVVFRGQKAYSGVAIVSREPAQDVAWGLDDGGEPDEARLIRATIGGLHVVNTYVPQGKAIDAPEFEYKLQWFARLRDMFARHYAPDQALAWLGDFNVAPEPIDVYDPEGLVDNVDFDPRARRALEEARQWGWVDVLRLLHPGEAGHYTYWDYRIPNALKRGMGWRIDHIWVTQPLASRVRSVWIDISLRQAPKPSDHTVLVAEFDMPTS